MSAPMFRAILLLYPSEFRHEYGSEMTRVYADLRRDEPAARLWLRLARDTALAAPRLRMEAGMKRSVLVITVVAMLGVAAAGIATGNFFIGGLLLLGLAALLLVPSALLARRSRASAENDYTTRRWPFWSFPAVGIACTYLAFGIGQLIDDPKKENVFALVLFTGFAAMIARGLVLRRRGRVSGDWMIAAAALPLFPGFWMIWPPIVAMIVMIGSMTEALSARPARAA